MNCLCFIILCWLTVLPNINGSHFGGGELTWKLIERNGTIGSANFTSLWELYYRQSWRRSHGRARACNDNAIAKRTIVSSESSVRCTGCKSLQTVRMNYYCTDNSPLLNIVTGERTIRIQGSSSTTLFAWFTGCCWLRLINGGSRWQIWAKMDLNVTARKGRRLNSSPRAGSPLYITVLHHCPQTIDLKVTDEDNDIVRCRWAVGSSECGGVCTRVKGITLNEETCTLFYNRTDRIGVHGLAIVMEDFASRNDNESLSQASLHMLLYVYSKAITCDLRPYYMNETLADNSCIRIPVNTTWTSRIMVNVTNSIDRVSEFTTRSPSGLVKSKVAQLESKSTIYYMNATWTPTMVDRGSHTFCFTALTSTRVSSEQRCVTLKVGGERCLTQKPTTGPVTTKVTRKKVFCIAVTSGQGSSRGMLSWPSTETGLTIALTCPFGPEGAVATRRCIDRGGSVGSWDIVRNERCAYGKATTQELDDLKGQTITASNVNNITQRITGISDDVKGITPEDTSLLSDIVGNIVSSSEVSDEVADLLLKTSNNILNSNSSSLLDAQVTGGSLSSLVNSFDHPQPDNTTFKCIGNASDKVTKDIGMQAVQLPKNSFQGLNFAVKMQTGGQKQYKRDDIELSSTLAQNKSFEVVVTLPATFLNDATAEGMNSSRVAFIVYRDARFFKTIRVPETGIHEEAANVQIAGAVINVDVAGRTSLQLNMPLRISFNAEKNKEGKKESCRFWNFTANDGFGEWSSDGCRLIDSINGIVTCECDHLTNFAVLFDPLSGKVVAPIPLVHRRVLSAITYVGIGLSLGGIFLTLLTFGLFRQLRESTHANITIQICISLGVTLILFVATIDLKPSSTGCKVSALFMHYTLLVTFSWMFFLAVDLYLKFVKVLGSYIKSMVIKAAAVAWGVPALLVAISAGSRWEDYGNETACTVTSYAAYGFLFVPVLLVLVVNFVIFALVFKSLSARERFSQDKKNEGNLQLKFSLMCCFLLGFTWLFGAVAVGNARLVFQYFFCIFNSLQGFFIFYFQIVRKRNIKVFWIGFLEGRGRIRRPSSFSLSSQGLTLRTKSRKSTASTSSTHSHSLSFKSDGKIPSPVNEDSKTINFSSNSSQVPNGIYIQDPESTIVVENESVVKVENIYSVETVHKIEEENVGAGFVDVVNSTLEIETNGVLGNVEDVVDAKTVKAAETDTNSASGNVEGVMDAENASPMETENTDDLKDMDESVADYENVILVRIENTDTTEDVKEDAMDVENVDSVEVDTSSEVDNVGEGAVDLKNVSPVETDNTDGVENIDEDIADYENVNLVKINNKDATGDVDEGVMDVENVDPVEINTSNDLVNSEEDNVDVKNVSPVEIDNTDGVESVNKGVVDIEDASPIEIDSTGAVKEGNESTLYTALKTIIDESIYLGLESPSLSEELTLDSELPVNGDCPSDNYEVPSIGGYAVGGGELYENVASSNNNTLKSVECSTTAREQLDIICV